MPMFYVNWGRYTQLAGQVLLMIGVWFTWTIFKSKEYSWRILIPTWMIIGSLAMTHYRVMIFYVIFIIAYLVLNSNKRTFILLIKKTIWIGLGAGVIFLPWFVNVFGGRIISHFNAMVTNTPSVTSSSGARAISYSIGNLTTYLPILLWVIATLTLAICLWQRKHAVATVSLWWFMLFLVANSHWFNLPGRGIINNFAIFIAVYIPASLIIASIPELLYEISAQNKLKLRIINLTLAVVILGLGLSGAWQRRSEVNPITYALAAEPDMRAADWIKDNITPEAHFLVNTFFAFYDTVIVGSDGGWWLPLLADRQTTLPPITYNFEEEPFPGYNKWVQVPTRRIESYGITHPETLSTLVEYGVTHVYIGQQQGSVNYTGPLRIKPTELQDDPHFKTIYHQDRVWIFEFEP
jgi:hypothetical protein